MEKKCFVTLLQNKLGIKEYWFDLLASYIKVRMIQIPIIVIDFFVKVWINLKKYLKFNLKVSIKLIFV